MNRREERIDIWLFLKSVESGEAARSFAKDGYTKEQFDFLVALKRERLKQIEVGH